METKICSNCGQEKPISEFPKCKRNKDGLDTHCKECRNAKNKVYREANKDKVFTCEKDPTLPNDSKRVVLKEDENNPKWLFHVTDLELVM